MRFICVVLWLLGAVATTHAAPITLYRGVGVHEWMNWSPTTNGVYNWPPYRTYDQWLTGSRPLSDWPSGDQFQRMGRMGFSFVRLSVDPGPLLANTGARRQQALDIIQAAVQRIKSNGLNVVLDLHAVSQVPAYGMITKDVNSAEVVRYRGVVVDTAKMLLKVGVTRVAIEPYNEPQYYGADGCNSRNGDGTGLWQAIMAKTVAEIRAVSRDLTIVATGACGGGINGLTRLNPVFDDPNILYSFHMYRPHEFTHQRWDANTFFSGLPWPAAPFTSADVIYWLKRNMTAAGLTTAQQNANITKVKPDIDKYFVDNWGTAQLYADFKLATDWAAANSIPRSRLFMGEFGAMLITPDGKSGAFKADRDRYIATVREFAERTSNNIPWAIWEYSNPYGMSVIKPVGPAVPDDDLLRALRLLP